MNLDYMAIILCEYDEAVKIAESKVGVYGKAIVEILRLLPKIQPNSIKIRKSTPGVLIFYGPYAEIEEIKKHEYIEFGLGRFKRFSYRKGPGLQVEFYLDKIAQKGICKDWDLIK